MVISRVPVRLRGVVSRFDSRTNAGDLDVDDSRVDEIGSERVRVPVDVDELAVSRPQ